MVTILPCAFEKSGRLKAEQRVSCSSLSPDMRVCSVLALLPLASALCATPHACALLALFLFVIPVNCCIM